VCRSCFSCGYFAAFPAAAAVFAPLITWKLIMFIAPVLAWSLAYVLLAFPRAWAVVVHRTHDRFAAISRLSRLVQPGLTLLCCTWVYPLPRVRGAMEGWLIIGW
jgi:hypothetical protein